MLPTLELRSDVDVLKHSPLVRGMTLALRYVEENGGIGLTKSGALNRKFVNWAAEHFEWPEYTAIELFKWCKVLEEHRMPPLFPVHGELRYLKLLRRSKGKLVATKKGREMAKAPDALFNLVAPSYLYLFVHDDGFEARGIPLGNWDIFLNVINVEARAGCTLAHLNKTLYGWEKKEFNDLEHSNLQHALELCVVRPLCWLGLLREDREGLGYFDDGTYYKTPLWHAALKLRTDGVTALRLV